MERPWENHDAPDGPFRFFIQWPVSSAHSTPCSKRFSVPSIDDRLIHRRPKRFPEAQHPARPVQRLEPVDFCKPIPVKNQLACPMRQRTTSGRSFAALRQGALRFAGYSRIGSERQLAPTAPRRARRGRPTLGGLARWPTGMPRRWRQDRPTLEHPRAALLDRVNRSWWRPGGTHRQFGLRLNRIRSIVIARLPIANRSSPRNINRT